MPGTEAPWLQTPGRGPVPKFMGPPWTLSATTTQTVTAPLQLHLPCLRPLVPDDL